MHPRGELGSHGCTIAYRRLVRWVGIVGVLIPLTVRCGGDGFREDEIACLRGVDKIATCCPALPAFDATCEFIEGSADCSTVVEDVRPALDVAQADCLEKTSCREMVAAGLCEAIRPGSGEGANAGGSGAGASAGVGQAGAAGQLPDVVNLRIAIARRPLCL